VRRTRHRKKSPAAIVVAATPREDLASTPRRAALSLAPCLRPKRSAPTRVHRTGVAGLPLVELMTPKRSPSEEVVPPSGAPLPAETTAEDVITAFGPYQHDQFAASSNFVLDSSRTLTRSMIG
jgi:hypothetical protein